MNLFEQVERARLLLLEASPLCASSLEDGADEALLYRRWFHRETGEFVAWPARGAYRAAILDPDRLETGWRVIGAGPALAGAVLAMRGGFQRIVAPPEMAPEDPRNLSPGLGAIVRVDPLLSGESEGFWHVWSAGWQRGAPLEFYRVYCRVSPSRALRFVKSAAQAAPPRPVWAMKALCGEHQTGRRDGALLYLPADQPFDKGWVARIIETLAPDCAGDLPPFVEPLRPGIGWAADPGDGRSFGQAVSGAMASASSHAADPVRYREAAVAALRSLPGMARQVMSKGAR